MDQSKKFKDGRLIGHDEATTLLNLYFERMHGGQAPTDVYGYVFSLEALKALIAQCDKQNASGSKKQVYGIRIYECIDPRKRPDGKSDCKSVMLVPVDANLHDLIPVNIHHRESIFEGEVIEPIIEVDPRPCPNLCELITD